MMDLPVKVIAQFKAKDAEVPSGPPFEIPLSISFPLIFSPLIPFKPSLPFSPLFSPSPLPLFSSSILYPLFFISLSLSLPLQEVPPSGS